MAHILILGGGAAGLAAALAAAQAAPAARVTVLERNPKVGKKLLATGNGRCNLDNTAIAPEKYFTADPAALRPLLAAVDAAAPLAWFEQLGLYTRTDEAGRVYPYSNQAADVLALLELHLQRHTVQLRPGCTVSTLRQSKGGYAVQFTNAEGGTENLRADAVICAMGGAAGPQFGTDGFGTRFAADCGGQLRPLYPCLTALQCAKPRKALAGIRAKAAASLLDGARVLACENGEVQFTDYGLSGICIMQLSGLLAPGRGPKAPAVELDLFPAVDETALASLFAAHAAQTAGELFCHLVIPRPHRELYKCMPLRGAPAGGHAKPDVVENIPLTQALGIVETKGYTPNIQAVDAMLKAANVTLAGQARIGAAMVIGLVQGDVGAVEAAVAAGKSAASEIGQVVAAHLIPRPHTAVGETMPDMKYGEALA